LSFLPDGSFDLLYMQGCMFNKLEINNTNFENIIKTIEIHGLSNDFIYKIVEDYKPIEDIYEKLRSEPQLFEEFAKQLDSFIEKWKEHATAEFSFTDGGQNIKENFSSEDGGFGTFISTPHSTITLTVSDKYGLIHKRSEITSSMQKLIAQIQEFDNQRQKIKD